MPRYSVMPPSLPHEVHRIGDREERIRLMAAWFLDNFEDPANLLPYDGQDGGYQWIYGGPYDAEDELAEAYPGAPSEEISEAAADAIDSQGGLTAWSVGSGRVVDMDELQEDDLPPDDAIDTDPVFDPDDDPLVKRTRPPRANPQARTIVETILFPMRTYSWSVHVAFIPGSTNLELGEEFAKQARTHAFRLGEKDSGIDSVEDELFHFQNLRDLVGSLIDLELEGARIDADREMEDSRDWISHLSKDRQLFVDDNVIVHGSPPSWFPLEKLFEGGSLAALGMTSESAPQFLGYMVTFAGARICFRLVRNLNFLQDAFAERVADRIKRGDFDDGDDQKEPPKRRSRKKSKLA